MNINYEYYKIFHFVAKYQNITRAAQILRSSQPNITRAINCLEEQLGCRLFERSNRGVTLTPEGERLKRRITLAMAQILAAEDELAGETHAAGTRLSLALTSTALRLGILEKLHHFTMHHPTTRLSLTVTSARAAREALKNGIADCALSEVPVEDSALTLTPLLTYEEILVSGPQTSERMPSHPLTLDALTALPLITPARDSDEFGVYNELFLTKGLTLNPRIEVQSITEIPPLVCEDMGLAILPRAWITDKMIEVPLAEPLPPRTLFLMTPAAHPLTSPLRTLKETLLTK